MNTLFALLQRLLPQHAVSRLAGWLAESRTAWIRRPFVHGFARFYQVDLTEAERPHPDDYACFNDFFTRRLRAGSRPLDPDPAALLSPVDGVVSQAGALDHDQLLQAKGHRYRLAELIGAEAPEFHGGSFATMYLAPRDYHRVHAPFEGTVTSSTAIPGRLFSVNGRTEHAIPRLFCRNERLVCRLETVRGPLLVVLVGALIVASIETVWGEPRSPYRRLERHDWQRALRRGEEMGRFLLGSTVILCCPPGLVRWEPGIRSGARVRMGERLGVLV